MKTRNVIAVAVALMATIVSQQASAQSNVPPDLTILSDHQTLVDSCWNSVRGGTVSAYAGTEVQSGSPSFYFDVTNAVKDVYVLRDIVSVWTWEMDVIDTNDFISLSGQIYDQSPLNPPYGNSTRLMFNAWGGGTPTKSGNSYVLPQSGETLTLSLTPYLFISVSNIAYARMIIDDPQYGVYSFDLGVHDNGMDFTTPFAGYGILVYGQWIYNTNGYYTLNTVAFDLATQKPVKINPVYFQFLFGEQSQDFVAYRDQQSLDTLIPSYNGFGVVPLIMPKFDFAISNVLVSAHTYEGQFASKFVIRNKNTGVETTNSVPSGQTGIRYNFDAASYSIRSIGIQLRPYMGYYGGKG